MDVANAADNPYKANVRKTLTGLFEGIRSRLLPSQMFPYRRNYFLCSYNGTGVVWNIDFESGVHFGI